MLNKKIIVCCGLLFFVSGCTKSVESRLIEDEWIKKDEGVYVKVSDSEEPWKITHKLKPEQLENEFTLDLNQHEFSFTNQYPEGFIQFPDTTYNPAYFESYVINFEKKRVTRIRNNGMSNRILEDGTSLVDSAITEEVGEHNQFICEYNYETDTYRKLENGKAMVCEGKEKLKKAYQFFSDFVLDELDIREEELR